MKYINYKTATEEYDLADVAGSIIFLTPCPVNSTTPKSSPKMKIHSHTNLNVHIGNKRLIQDWPALPGMQPGMTHSCAAGCRPVIQGSEQLKGLDILTLSEQARHRGGWTVRFHSREVQEQARLQRVEWAGRACQGSVGGGWCSCPFVEIHPTVL